jgi:ABC-2 type transport system permease protein
MSTDARTGVIHDIGYQRYTGERLGRSYAVQSLFIHSLRGAFGLGRSAKAKIFPWIIIGILFFVAVVSVVLRAVTGELSITYLEFPGISGGLLLALFLCSAAPELISRDLRSKVLPLYFSRPISRSDYALAKLGATVVAAFLVLFGPMLLMFVGSAFSVKHFSEVLAEFSDFVFGLGMAAIYALVFGVLAAVISSLFSRRVVAAAVLLGYFLLTSAVAGVLAAISQFGTAFHIGLVVSPAFMLTGLRTWLNGETGGDFSPSSYGPWYLSVTIVFILIGTGLLILRYRKVEA